MNLFNDCTNQEERIRALRACHDLELLDTALTTEGLAKPVQADLQIQRDLIYAVQKLTRAGAVEALLDLQEGRTVDYHPIGAEIWPDPKKAAKAARSVADRSGVTMLIGVNLAATSKIARRPEVELSAAQQLARVLALACYEGLARLLTVAENQTDADALEEAAKILEADGVASEMVEAVRDRVRTLRRPQPGETKVLSTETRRLTVKLTPSEVEAAAREVVRLCEEVEKKEGEKKRLTDAIGAELKLLNRDRAHQVKLHRTGEDERDIPVTLYLDLSTHRVQIRRDDTGERVGEREAYAWELQEELPLERAAK